MKDASEYLQHIKALIVLMPQVKQWIPMREESQGDSGLFRYRLTLSDGSLLEMFEFFQIETATVNVKAYSFHWQTSDGHLLKRWDNAAHHSELETHPHHVHIPGEVGVASHHPVNAESVLAIITHSFKESDT